MLDQFNSQTYMFSMDLFHTCFNQIKFGVIWLYFFINPMTLVLMLRNYI